MKKRDVVVTEPMERKILVTLPLQQPVCLQKVIRELPLQGYQQPLVGLMYIYIFKIVTLKKRKTS